MSAERSPEALLLVATGCPHCSQVLDALVKLVKEGILGRIEVVNVAVQAETAQRLGVRSVPWLRLGPFELPGLQSEAELRHWAELALAPDGFERHLLELLQTGGRRDVLERLRREPERLPALATLLGRADAGIDARLGVIATLEDLAAGGPLEGLVTPLAALLEDPDPRIRNDTCHALALTGSTRAEPLLRRCLTDPDPGVRETAAEALQEKGDGGIKT